MWRLFDLLFPPRVDEAALREVSDDTFLSLLAPHVTPITRPGTVTLLPFSDRRVRAAVHEAKYHGSGRAFRLLASALADYLRDADEIVRGAIMVPVPLGRARRKKRGFNQVEEAARRALRELGRSSAHGLSLDTTLLVRVRETETQVSRTRAEREENLRGAFGAARPADPAHLYMVLDDVITTGATLQAAADALKSAGATDILLIALAHAD